MDHRHPEPTGSGDRAFTIDTLRGFALLGILVPNVIVFGWPSAASSDITILGDTQANRLALAITQTVFLGKFMFLFALLFGAGLLLYARKFDDPHADPHSDRDPDRPAPPLRRGAALWYRRCAVLLVFGLIHAYGFWFGDILTWYALAGFGVLWWVRRWKTQYLVIGGAALFLLGTLLLAGLSLLGLWAFQNGHASQDELMGHAPESEISAYLGTNRIGQRYGAYASAFVARFPTTLFMHLLLMPLFIPAVSGIMMLGMASLRSGILTGRLKAAASVSLGAVLILLGGAFTLTIHTVIGGASSFQGAFLWQTLAQPVGIPLAFGYLFLVVGLAQIRALRTVLTPLASVGRTALSNYFLQTLMCTTLFYGYGFGLFASIDYPRLWVVVGAVWVTNLTLSTLWLKHFRFGPAEWVWRCATYGQLVPIRVKKA